MKTPLCHGSLLVYHCVMEGLMNSQRSDIDQSICHCFQKLQRIPPKFLKHISSVGSKKAILQGPSGSKWHVELGKDMKDTFLTAGWPKFVEDHSLREYEFLVFQYDGDMHFTVLVFDTSACEREDVFAVRPRRQPRQCEGKRKRGRPPKHSPEVGCIVKSEAIEHGMSLELRKDDVHQPNLLQIQPFQQCGLPSPAPACDVKVEREESELLINILRNTTKRSKGGRISTRRPLTEIERLRAEEAANSFTSAFPYIVMRMAPSQVYRPYMRIPKWFSRAHLPPKRSNLVLRDPSGKSWIVTYIPSLRCQISRGWSVFARTNNLEEGDYCVLELIGPIELRVHIFRAVEAEETLEIATTPTA
ncbi:hypothetical protein BHE74_00001155 [Ensete ventricosum]|nr:hypothetical protein BHE74_00001155 [Ensete ventricosum]